MKIFGLLPMTKMFAYYTPAAVYGARNIRLLFNQSARISTSNDGGIPPCTPAMMQQEIDLFDLFLNTGTGENIFTGADAIKMATINSAACLGLEDQLGSIEAGKTVVRGTMGFRGRQTLLTRFAPKLTQGYSMTTDV